MVQSRKKSIQELIYKRIDMYQLIRKNTEVMSIRCWVEVTLSRDMALIYKRVNTRTDMQK